VSQIADAFGQGLVAFHLKSMAPIAPEMRGSPMP
jgi:hypothetical protein